MYIIIPYLISVHHLTSIAENVVPLRPFYNDTVKSFCINFRFVLASHQEYPSAGPSVFLSVCLSVRLSFHLSIFPSFLRFPFQLVPGQSWSSKRRLVSSFSFSSSSLFSIGSMSSPTGRISSQGWEFFSLFSCCSSHHIGKKIRSFSVRFF